MAIEIIPKKEKEDSSFKKNLYYVATALLILSIFSSLIFFLLSLKFSREISAVNYLIEDQKTEEMLVLEKKIGDYDKKTKNLPLIIQNRSSSLFFFNKIEELTHPFVFFLEFKANVSENTISALGVAQNIVAFDQQIRIFEEEDSINSFDIPNFDIQEDRTIIFPISIIFK